MMKTVFVISFLLLFVSCQKQNCENDSGLICTSSTQENQQAPETPIPGQSPPAETGGDSGSSSPSGLPHEVYLFDANVALTKFNSYDEEKVMMAIEIIKKVIRSVEFRDRVIQFSYAGKKGFVDSQGLSNDQIYQKLLEGSETLDPDVDHEMDLDLELYYSRRSTVGYTYPDGLRIWMNTKFFRAYNPAEVAGNIFHEWTHKLGFEHAYRYSASRDFSVPYALGYLIEELGRKYL